MYQGKFDNKHKKTDVDVHELLNQRNSAPEKKKKSAAPVPAPAAEPAAPAKKQKKAVAPAEVTEVPEKKRKKAAAPVEVAEVPEKKEKKGPRMGGVIFYTFYFMFILLFFVASFFGLKWLQGWLVDYEAAQPTVKCEEVFTELFSDPDWAALYDMAGIEDGLFEGKDAYVSYMENLVGDSELTYVKTSAGLSGGHKYFVQLDDVRLGHYILKDATEGIAKIPDWQLSEVELYVNREKSVQVQKLEGSTVYVNGVPIDDSHTIRISSTVADEYLPSGTTGLRICTQKIDGLLCDPEITVTNQNGENVEVTWNEEKGMYVQQFSAATMGPQEKERILKAAETYAKYMIEEATWNQLGQYFLSSSDIYKTIVRMELWMQGNNGYNFTNQTVSEYTRYTDDLFSARVSLSLNVTRTNGTVKEYKLDTTLFFEMQSNGKWMVYDMTNKDVQQEISKVRLTFMDGDTVLASEFVENNASHVDAPVLSAPEGQVFAGWFVKSIDENGNTVMDQVFAPSEDGKVAVPSGTVLEPMVLYARFESAS